MKKQAWSRFKQNWPLAVMLFGIYVAVKNYCGQKGHYYLTDAEAEEILKRINTRREAENFGNGSVSE